jgi:hypothetical protein
VKALLLFMWRKREAGYHGHGRGGAGRAGVGDTHDRSNFGAVVDRFKATFQAVWGAYGFRDYLAPPPPPPPRAMAAVLRIGGGSAAAGGEARLLVVENETSVFSFGDGRRRAAGAPP